MADARRITAEQAKDKAEECRELARKAVNAEHRKMLEEMADAWDEIASGR